MDTGLVRRDATAMAMSLATVIRALTEVPRGAEEATGEGK